MAMYPLCYLVAEFSAAEIVLYSVWSVVNVVYRSYWATVAGAPVAAQLHGALGHHDAVAHWVLLGEVLQTGGNAYLLVRCAQRLWALGKSPRAHKEMAVPHTGVARA